VSQPSPISVDRSVIRPPAFAVRPPPSLSRAVWLSVGGSLCHPGSTRRSNLFREFDFSLQLAHIITDGIAH
jgi:hypothetical protein